ncbi:pilus assembly protein TadG-related protein [Salinibacterium sp. SYSU T00001]|uniref:TadE/TadG family type IV pilus assembly protein n=1 Tax=Homoserinimonas sedimenticola TaxID=2986805 RepID=UPI002235FCB2|nr:pilus assembly protein TadG-related protein [Salinibacterium sedimenticola]MCW4385431.1 pilus assembly protein TadG-related protein [Salinibacterium sedimenticola]
MRRALQRLRGDESGAAAVMVGLVSVVLIAMLALVIDYGVVQSRNGQLQIAADAAALAIANDCARGSATGCRATGSGLGLAAANDADSATATLSTSARQVTVTATRDVDFSLMASFGLTDATLTREATAEWTAATTTGGAVTGASVYPFLVEECIVPSDFREVRVTARLASYSSSCRWIFSPARQLVRVSTNCNKVAVRPGQWLSDDGTRGFGSGCSLPSGRIVVALWDDYEYSLFGADRYRISGFALFDPDPNSVTSTGVSGTFYPLDSSHPDVTREPGATVPGTARLID